MPGSKRRALKKLLSPSASPSSSPSAGVPITPQDSQTSIASQASLMSQSSIASDPGNYLSDEALQQDLAVEEMMEREKSIGSGDHRVQDGVASFGADGSMPPPPPPKAAEEGMHNPQQMTAERLMFGDESGKGKKKSSKQRHAERQARRMEAMMKSAPPDDPGWTAQLEKERQEEIQIISDACTSLGRVLHEIPPDGHCMFNAISDQLVEIGLLPPQNGQDPRYARQTAANYMLAHPDDFMPFLPSITGEDSAGATEHDGLITESEFKKYCSNVAETGEWGGEPEIQALSRAFKVPIHVIQRGPPTIVSHGGDGDNFGGGMTPEQSAAQGDKVVRISYHKRMYGLGEHYNSLRKPQ